MIENKNKDFAIRLEAIIDTAIDGIITISDRGMVETMNHAAAGIFGYDESEIIGHNINVLMPAPYRREHDGYLERYNRTKEPRIIGTGREVRGKKKNGEVFPFRLAVSEVILNDRIIFTGIIHDLSEVKKAQKEIIVLNQKLEDMVARRTQELEKAINQLLTTNNSLESEIKERSEIEKLLKKNELELKQSLEKEKELSEMKSRFVTTASHEFRTPLTSILSSVSLIGKYQENSQQSNREKHIHRIKSAVSDLTGILNDFLSLSKLEEGRVDVDFSEVDLKELCSTVARETRGLLKGDQKVQHKLSGHPTTVNSDSKILKNILFNLVSNAIKYSDIDIYCDITISDSHFEIKIRDQGIGIPAEDQKFLFTRFFRAGNVTNIQGTGLGLNIVRRYVELLEGDISYTSELEVGSTFHVKIPKK